MINQVQILKIYLNQIKKMVKNYILKHLKINFIFFIQSKFKNEFLTLEKTQSNMKTEPL